MFEIVSFLIPYKPDNGIRDINYKWIKQFYKKMFPKAEVCVGVSNEKQFNRSQAINLAAKQATREIFIIVDADVFCDPDVIKDSIELLKKAPWVIPYSYIMRISKENSKRLVKAAPTWPIEITDYEMIDTSKFTFDWVGHINVITREHFLKVRGFDERFSGWGGEDDAFSCAVNTICGYYTRLDHAIYHLWHPVVGYENNPNGDRNKKLREMFYQANNDKQKMEQVISSIKSIFNNENRKL